MELLPNATSFRLGDIHANAHILQQDHNAHLIQIQQLFDNVKAEWAADQLERAQQSLTQLDDYINGHLQPACLAGTCQQAYVEGAALAGQYIEQKDQDPDGYLLAGNMRLLSGKYKAALKIYDDGIQFSSHDHPQYPELVSQRDHAKHQKIATTPG